MNYEKLMKFGVCFAGICVLGQLLYVCWSLAKKPPVVTPIAVGESVWVKAYPTILTVVSVSSNCLEVLVATSGGLITQHVSPSVIRRLH